MEDDNINVFELVLNALNSEGIWFTQKTDPTYQEASSYYVLDEYGDPTEKTIARIEKEVKSLIGDGAIDITDAIELWKNDQMIEARLDFVDNLVTKFEPKPVVDDIKAYENPVQFPSSKKVEAKSKKTEGAGAGYEISGTVLSAKVNNFEIIGNTTNQYNEKMYELKCDIDVKLEDVQFESYDYGGKIDFPIDGKVTYLIVAENGNNDVEGDLTSSDIENALDGAKIKEMLGGGWVHETFTGDFSGEFDGDVYGDYYALDYEMTLTQDTVVDFIDKKVDGVMDEVTYCVYNREGDPVDDFTDKDEAIEFAKKNDCIEVIEKYHDYQLIDADGSIDDNSYEDGDIVWEREYTKQYKFDDEVEESKKVKTEAKSFNEVIYGCFDRDGELLIDFKDKEEAIKYFEEHDEVDSVKEIINNYDGSEVDQTLGKEVYPTLEESKKVKDEQQAELDAYADELDECTNVKVETKSFGKALRELKLEANTELTSEQKADKIANIGSLIDRAKYPFQLTAVIHTLGFIDQDLSNKLKQQYNPTTIKQDGIEGAREGIAKIIYDDTGVDVLASNTEFATESKDVNFKQCTKDKKAENYQKRLEEVNNKSANTISDMLQAEDFDETSNAGKIILRTQDLFTTLSDLGLNVDVTFDNGDSTTTVQLGTSGGKVIITINDPDKPLKAFMSGNVEITGDSLDKFKTIEDRIKTV